MVNSKEIIDFIKHTAKELGFDACGVTDPFLLEPESNFLISWLSNGYNGSMEYMNRNFEKRISPDRLEQWTKSVIVLAYNYHPVTNLDKIGSFNIAKYSYGEDYHSVLKEKMNIMTDIISTRLNNNFRFRNFVDSAPVMEKPLAVKAGLGWIGKNGSLIINKKGSRFFLCEIFTDLELTPDKPYIKNGCGKCRKCLDSCPSNAILSPYIVDSRQCISYLTIENKDETLKLPANKKCYIFGCDICQDVCPWNKFSIPNEEPRFQPSEELINLNTYKKWQNLSVDKFDKLFKKSPVKRAKYENIMRNIKAYL